MRRKLHSLTGVVPVGCFLVFYLWIGAKAMYGRQAFEEAVVELLRIPYVQVLEGALIWLPFAYHALYGLKIIFEARPNLRRYPRSRNGAYTMQRVTGLLTLAFVAYHFWQLRLPVLLGEMVYQDLFPTLCEQFSSTSYGGIPVVAILHLLGIAAVVFHFANGLSGFCFSWGITASQRASRIATGVFGFVGVLLFILGANSVIYFATGSRLVLAPRNALHESPAVTCEDLQQDREPTAHADGLGLHADRAGVPRSARADHLAAVDLVGAADTH